MKNKRSLIFLGIALLIAAIVLVVEPPENFRINDSHEKQFIKDFDSANIMRIEVEQFLDGAELKRDGNKWLVTSYLTSAKKELLGKEEKPLPTTQWHITDHARVESALGFFGGLQEGVLVSNNPQKQSLYQLDAAGVAVRGFDTNEREIFDIVVGKAGPDFSSTYIRRADDANVYLINRPIVGVFSPNATDWRERKIWAIDPSEIEKVAVTSKKESWEMKKGDDGSWKVVLPSEAQLDAAKAFDIVTKLSGARAVDFADDIDPKITGLDSPEITLTLAYSKDKSTSLSLGQIDKQGRTYARLSGVEGIYLLSKEFTTSIPLEAPK